MEEICCPKFDPKKYDNKTLIWKNKVFIKAKAPTFFYIPIGFGRVMTKLQEKVDKANVKILDNMCLSLHESKWSMNVYLAVNKKIKDEDNVLISGKFFCKVYEGPFEDTGKWMEDFEKVLKKNKMISKKFYMWYTTCPKCAKKYGHNYTVVIAEI